MSVATRAVDEMHLVMLALARAGHPLTAISASLRKTDRFAATTISRIRDADLAESGEPPELVRAAYPVTRPKAEKGQQQ